MDKTQNEIWTVQGPAEIVFKNSGSLETMNNKLPVDQKKCSVLVPETVTLNLTGTRVDFKVDGSEFNFTRNSVVRILNQEKETIW